jgi:hypothetical protein
VVHREEEELKAVEVIIIVVIRLEESKIPEVMASMVLKGKENIIMWE